VHFGYKIFFLFAFIFIRRRLQKVKNIIQWKRGSSLNNLDRISLMRHDLDELKENERQLDALIKKMKESSKLHSENEHSFVTCQDLHDIEMYHDQMILIVKAPPETQLSLIENEPLSVVLKSEKDEIDIFFCPDSVAGGGLQPALADTDDDEEDLNSPKQHRKAASSSSSVKRRSLGSAQRNLSKAFDEMDPEARNGKSKSNLFSAFNATVQRESNSNGVLEDADDGSTNRFKSTTITTKDLMLLNEPSTDDHLEPSFGIKKDVKLSLFSPQKNFQTNGNTASWSEMPELSPNFPLSHSDGFFPLEPDAGYNFLLDENEGILDLFDYNV
jgi:hypothetical protein